MRRLEKAEMKKRIDMPKAAGTFAIAMAVLFMTAGVSITARAAGFELIREKNGGASNAKTTVEVGVTKEIPQNVSYEVPLYYTFAILKNENGNSNSTIILPEGYGIRSTITPSEPLVVTKLDVSSVNGGTWSLVDAFDNTETDTTRKMKVSIGGFQLPDVTAGDINGKEQIDVRAQESSFYKNGSYQILGGTDADGKVLNDGFMELPVEVKIPDVYKPTSGTGVYTAQFRVKYTLSPLDGAGNPFDFYNQKWVNDQYDGPESGTTDP